MRKPGNRFPRTCTSQAQKSETEPGLNEENGATNQRTEKRNEPKIWEKKDLEIDFLELAVPKLRNCKPSRVSTRKMKQPISNLGGDKIPKNEKKDLAIDFLELAVPKHGEIRHRTVFQGEKWNNQSTTPEEKK